MKTKIENYTPYLLTVVGIIGFPIILNFILQWNSGVSIIGESKDWLVFWGAYISGAMTFFIIWQNYQMRRDIKKDQINSLLRNEQIKKIEWVRNVIIKYYKVMNPWEISNLHCRLTDMDYQVKGIDTLMKECSEMQERLGCEKISFTSTFYYLEGSIERDEYQTALNEAAKSKEFYLRGVLYILTAFKMYKYYDGNLNIIEAIIDYKKSECNSSEEKEVYEYFFGEIKKRYRQEHPGSQLVNLILDNKFHIELIKAHEILLDKSEKLLVRETDRLYEIGDVIKKKKKNNNTCK